MGTTFIRTAGQHHTHESTAEPVRTAVPHGLVRAASSSSPTSPTASFAPATPPPAPSPRPPLVPDLHLVLTDEQELRHGSHEWKRCRELLPSPALTADDLALVRRCFKGSEPLWCDRLTELLLRVSTPTWRLLDRMQTRDYQLAADEGADPADRQAAHERCLRREDAGLALYSLFHDYVEFESVRRLPGVPYRRIWEILAHFDADELPTLEQRREVEGTFPSS
ncbi:hypothetical protein JCM10207_008661 [Rhodosporidiobolus poonsookiae]